jgi:hypothetical protein
MPPRDHSLFAILHHELAQRVHQVRTQLLELLVVRPQRQLRERFLHGRRRLLAVNPKRRARGCYAMRGLRALKRRHAAVIRRIRLAIQDFNVILTIHISRHVFQ